MNLTPDQSGTWRRLILDQRMIQELSLEQHSSTGYLHPMYAKALRQHGEPVFLPRSGGWVLERPIPGSTEIDAMGCYPLFVCANWDGLEADLDNIGRDWVSFVAVTDPFGNYSLDQLRRCFPDLMRPYKRHFVADLHRKPEEFVCRKHRSKVRKAFQLVKVDVCNRPADIAGDWVRLYSRLIERHCIQGIAAFSPEALVNMLEVPGLVALKATIESEVVCVLLIYVQGYVAYPHLQASSEAGYGACASYAAFWTAMKVLAGQGVRWLDLGAGAGAHGNQNDGLNRFKQGWSSDTRQVYLCGRIFRPDAYARLVAERGAGVDDYFPAYRAGEFR